MAQLAVELRPAVTGLIMFVAFAAMPWRHPRPAAVVVGEAWVQGSVTMELPPAVAMPNLGDPAAGEFPDARDWPRGMVIHPLPHPDRNNLSVTRLWDKVLSVFLSPLHVLGA